MNLTDLKADKQRDILRLIGQKLIETADEYSDREVETHLETLQSGYLEVLGSEDFFGTEGWEHWLGLD